MRGSTVLCLLAACGEPATGMMQTPDAPAGPDASCDAREGAAPGQVHCESSTGFPSECVRPADVQWITGDDVFTVFEAPLPAGVYLEDPVAGCMWVVARPAPDGRVTVEATALGCTMTLGVPDTFERDRCGHYSAGVEGCADIYIFAEACFSTGRGADATGGVQLSIDAATQTLRTRGLGFDTSSSPASCACH